MGAMATYVRAGLPEAATALTALTGEPHPLAVKNPDTGPAGEYPHGPWLALLLRCLRLVQSSPNDEISSAAMRFRRSFSVLSMGTSGGVARQANH